LKFDTFLETPQVWLIKQSNMLNNGRSILSNEADDCSCDTQLPLYDYNTNPECNNLTVVPSTVGKMINIQAKHFMRLC